MLAATQVGGEKQTKQVSGTSQLAALATQARPGRPEPDAREWQAYGFCAEIKLKSEIPDNRIEVCSPAFSPGLDARRVLRGGQRTPMDNLNHSMDRSRFLRFLRGFVALAALLIGAAFSAIAAPGTPIAAGSGDSQSESAPGEAVRSPTGQRRVQ